MIPHWFPSRQIQGLQTFRDFHKLAEGAFGEVYEATFDPPTGAPQTVVVKRLKPAYASENAKYRDTFLHEAGILKILAHPGIPRYIDGYISSNECFYIMERKRGINLNRLLRNTLLAKKKISMNLAFFLMDRILEILLYLHSPSKSGEKLFPVVHCDIKPENILVDDQLNVSLIDFAMAVQLDEPKRFLGGTKSYLPPEFFLDQAPCPPSDLYSSTAVFFDLLALKSFFKKGGNDYDLFMQLLKREYLEKVRKQKFPAPLETLLLKGLAYRPEERFPSAEEYRVSLSECAGLLGIDFTGTQDLRVETESLRRLSP